MPYHSSLKFLSQFILCIETSSLEQAQIRIIKQSHWIRMLCFPFHHEMKVWYRKPWDNRKCPK